MRKDYQAHEFEIHQVEGRFFLFIFERKAHLRTDDNEILLLYLPSICTKIRLKSHCRDGSNIISTFIECNSVALAHDAISIVDGR
jgi:hypothetical protein